MKINLLNIVKTRNTVVNFFFFSFFNKAKLKILASILGSQHYISTAHNT